jgi:nickel-dependent lactate racemase
MQMFKEFKTVYAGKELTLKIPESNVVNVVMPHEVPTLSNPEEAMRKLLEKPIGCEKLVDMVKPGDKVALITSEYMRMPYTWILGPVVVDMLKKEVGVKDKNIFLVHATGTHQTEEEQIDNPNTRKVFGPLSDRYRLVMHDCDKREHNVFIGYTTLGTPVWVNKTVAEADVKIGFGELSPHHAAGHCGGGKIILPGVCNRSTIGSMHRRVLNQKNEKGHKEWQTGAYGNDEKNEVRRDIEDAAALAGLDFKIDPVTKRPAEGIYGIYAGDPVKEFRESMKLCHKVQGTQIKEKTDICVYLSGARGNYVTGVFWYAPFFSDQVTKDDGIVIHVIPGENGWAAPSAHQCFTPKVMTTSSEEIARAIAGDREIPADARDMSCAWQVKKAIEDKRTFMVTQYANKELLTDFGIRYVTNSFDEALSKAFEEKGKEATVTVLYQGAYALPPS